MTCKHRKVERKRVKTLFLDEGGCEYYWPMRWVCIDCDKVFEKMPEGSKEVKGRIG